MTQFKLSQLILVLIAASSITSNNQSSFYCHAFGKKKIRATTLGSRSGSNTRNEGQMDYSHSIRNGDSTNIFYDSFLLYRGGDNTDNNSEKDDTTTTTAAANDEGEEDTTAEGK